MQLQKIDPYAHANLIFLDTVGESSSRSLTVLDVGCWNGTLGRALLDRRPAVVDGVELDQTQAEAARRAGYRNVYQLDLDSEVIPGEREGYDYILFGDVLEHLRMPENILTASQGLLKPGGRVLISVPNIAYILCRMKLLFGRWDYTDSGIMDRTHLRFFTVGSITRVLTNCGFAHEWTRGYVGLANYPAPIRELARWLGRVWPSLFAIQVVVCGYAAQSGDSSI